MNSEPLNEQAGLGAISPIPFEWESYKTGPAYNPRYEGYHVGHYCTGAPNYGWCLYSRGVGGCWNQRTEKLIPPIVGMEPRRINGAWFWVVPDAQPASALSGDQSVATEGSLQPSPDPESDAVPQTPEEKDL